MQALEAEQATLERAAARGPRPTDVSADAFPALDLDRQREIVASLVTAVSVVREGRFVIRRATANHWALARTPAG